MCFTKGNNIHFREAKIPLVRKHKYHCVAISLACKGKYHSTHRRYVDTYGVSVLPKGMGKSRKQAVIQTSRAAKSFVVRVEAFCVHTLEGNGQYVTLSRHRGKVEQNDQLISVGIAPSIGIETAVGVVGIDPREAFWNGVALPKRGVFKIEMIQLRHERLQRRVHRILS